MLRDAMIGPRQTLLFIRDPRDVICAMYLHELRKPQAAPGFAEFLALPPVASLALRYRRFAEFYSFHQHVGLFRYEQTLPGWHTIAAGLVAFLNLQIAPDRVAAIAAAIPAVSNLMPWQVVGGAKATARYGPPFAADALDRFEEDCADVLAALGFSRGRISACEEERPGAAPPARSPSVAGQKGGYVPPKLDIFEPDPVIFTRLRANSAASMRVLGRDVVMDVDSSGCRPVIGQPEAADRTVACFGCSFTYGVAVAAEETFCSRLQRRLPDWRVENHGVSSYGTAQNLLSLQRYLRWNRADYVAFCWIPQHQIRNVVDITWVQNKSRLLPAGMGGAMRNFPRAALDEAGKLVWRSSMVPRADLHEADWTDFSTEPFYRDLVCFRLFEAANALVQSHDGKFFIVILWDRLSDVLSGWLAHAGIDVVNSGVIGDEYRCLPDDPHANAAAHDIYADRIASYLTRNPGAATAPVPGGPAWPIGALT